MRGADIRFWAPVVTLNGANPMTVECHAPFVDPGVVVSASPVRLVGGEYHSLALKADGTVVGWGWNDDGQSTSPASASNVVAIAAGTVHSLALMADGTVIGWGLNSGDQLSIPAAATNVVAIEAGSSFSLALKADGTVVGWGLNSFGQLSIPESVTNVVAIAAGQYSGLALRADGTMVGWGLDFFGQTTIPESATNVVAIAAGAYHSLALRVEGMVLGWGGNQKGQRDIPAMVSSLDLGTTVSGAVNPNVPGAYLLNYSATNSIGAVGTATREVVVVDTTPPTIVCGGDMVTSADPGECTKSNVTFDVIATDACSEATLVCRPPSGSTFANGASTVTCTATDASGNSNSCAFTVTVVERTAPSNTCPTNQAAICTGPDGALVFFAADSTDNCDTGVTVTCTPPAGSFFPLGTNAVTCIATDASGNTNTCTFTITVENQIVPLLVIVQQGINAIIYWPVSCTDYRLEESASFSPASWVPAAALPEAVGSQYKVTVPVGTENRFFRLKVRVSDSF